jgi:hypothetical protein
MSGVLSGKKGVLAAPAFGAYRVNGWWSAVSVG